MRDASLADKDHKSFAIWMLIIFGMALCMVWISYLKALTIQIDVKNKILMEFEKYLPAKPFTHIFQDSGTHRTKDPVTIREIGVPLLFLMGYILLALLLIFFPQEVTAGSA